MFTKRLRRSDPRLRLQAQQAPDDGVFRPVIGHALQLDEFKKAFELSETGNAGGKIVLTI